MTKENVLILGNGGREHALCWKLSKSPYLKKLYCIPGNGGIESLAQTDTSVDIMNFEAVKQFAVDHEIGLIVIGKENPLVSGIVDFFKKNTEIKVFGPNQHAATLEGSKIFAKNFFMKHDIPTAPYHTFFSKDDAIYYLRSQAVYPVVIKADGLAQGKGVMIVQNEEEAMHSIKEMMDSKRFQSAGEKIVVESFLDGKELSYQLLFMEGDYVELIPSVDYKRALDNNQGPNTGGMGNMAPPPWLEDELIKKIKNKIIKKLATSLKMDGILFTGVLFLGLMICQKDPYVLEINVRFGDPESQVVLPLLKNDLLEIMLNPATPFSETTLTWLNQKATCIVLTSKGYPDHYEIDKPITGLEKLADKDNVLVFHAGTKKNGNQYYTCGGRVLNIVGLGDTWQESRQVAYEAAKIIHFEGKTYRNDIGLFE